MAGGLPGSGGANFLSVRKRTKYVLFSFTRRTGLFGPIGRSTLSPGLRMYAAQSIRIAENQTGMLILNPQPLDVCRVVLT